MSNIKGLGRRVRPLCYSPSPPKNYPPRLNGCLHRGTTGHTDMNKAKVIAITAYGNALANPVETATPVAVGGDAAKFTIDEGPPGAKGCVMDAIIRPLAKLLLPAHVTCNTGRRWSWHRTLPSG